MNSKSDILYDFISVCLVSYFTVIRRPIHRIISSIYRSYSKCKLMKLLTNYHIYSSVLNKQISDSLECFDIVASLFTSIHMSKAQQIIHNLCIYQGSKQCLESTYSMLRNVHGKTKPHRQNKILPMRLPLFSITVNVFTVIHSTNLKPPYR